MQLILLIAFILFIVNRNRSFQFRNPPRVLCARNFIEIHRRRNKFNRVVSSLF